MIEKIRTKITKNSVVIICILIVLTINLFFTFGKGPIMSSDSKFYSEQADKLISYGFNIHQYLGMSDSDYPHIFNLGFVLLAAVLIVLLGQYWGLGLIGFNLIISSFAIICLFKLLYYYTKHTLTILVGFIFLLLAQDFRFWIAYVLTDTFFSSLVFMTLFFALMSIKATNKIRPLHILELTLLVLLTGVVRPTFVPFIGTVILYFLWVYIVGKVKDKRGRFNRLLFLLLSISAIVCIFIFAYLVQSASIGQLKISSTYINSFVKMFNEGWIIHDRPDLSYKTPTTYFDFVLIIFKRLLFFFVFTNSAFSRLHNLINILFFIPVYSLTLITVIGFFKRDFELSDVRNNIFIICIASTICFSVFHSITLIDFDWRYRVPLVLPLITLACLGADFLFSYFKRTRIFK